MIPLSHGMCLWWSLQNNTCSSVYCDWYRPQGQCSNLRPGSVCLHLAWINDNQAMMYLARCRQRFWQDKTSIKVANPHSTQLNNQCPCPQPTINKHSCVGLEWLLLDCWCLPYTLWCLFNNRQPTTVSGPLWCLYSMCVFAAAPRRHTKAVSQSIYLYWCCIQAFRAHNIGIN